MLVFANLDSARKHQQFLEIMMPFVTMTTPMSLLLMMMVTMMTEYSSVNAVSNQRL